MTETDQIMRFLFFLFVFILLMLWVAFYCRASHRKLSNTLYIIASVMGVLFVAGFFRLI